MGWILWIPGDIFFSNQVGRKTNSRARGFRFNCNYSWEIGKFVWSLKKRIALSGNSMIYMERLPNVLSSGVFYYTAYHESNPYLGEFQIVGDFEVFLFKAWKLEKPFPKNFWDRGFTTSNREEYLIWSEWKYWNLGSRSLTRTYKKSFYFHIGNSRGIFDFQIKIVVESFSAYTKAYSLGLIIVPFISHRGVVALICWASEFQSNNLTGVSNFSKDINFCAFW